MGLYHAAKARLLFAAKTGWTLLRAKAPDAHDFRVKKRLFAARQSHSWVAQLADFLIRSSGSPGAWRKWTAAGAGRGGRRWRLPGERCAFARAGETPGRGRGSRRRRW